MEQDFNTSFNKAVQDAVVAFIKKGDWLATNYSNRIVVDTPLLRQAMSNIDMAKVSARVTEHIEQRIADNITNAMATEIANDVKSIMSNRELREDIRAVIREIGRAHV